MRVAAARALRVVGEHLGGDETDAVVDGDVCDRSHDDDAAGTVAPVPVTSTARVPMPPIRSAAGASPSTPPSVTKPASTSARERVLTARRWPVGESAEEHVPRVRAQGRALAAALEPERGGERLHVVTRRERPPVLEPHDPGDSRTGTAREGDGAVHRVLVDAAHREDRRRHGR